MEPDASSNVASASTHIQALLHEADVQPQKAVDLADPLAVALSKVVINRDHVHAFAAQRIQVRRQHLHGQHCDYPCNPIEDLTVPQTVRPTASM
jgi:hypothetical protein